MRLVNEGKDFGLIEQYWSLPMVMDANDALDIHEHLLKKSRESQNEKE